MKKKVTLKKKKETWNHGRRLESKFFRVRIIDLGEKMNQSHEEVRK